VRCIAVGSEQWLKGIRQVFVVLVQASAGEDGGWMLDCSEVSGNLVCAESRQTGSGHAGIKELHKKEAGQLKSRRQRTNRKTMP